jgi:hypothetical protein
VTVADLTVADLTVADLTVADLTVADLVFNGEVISALIKRLRNKALKHGYGK